eukprot:TRINITY_DN4600_c1_g1_i2.p1 TRINITY_DN4600_c1_g1~~TRINITY_DN4600_c1_g1_i2.p1  ORF type:complete len:630 (+),score=163.38 TRINITY_DN4600_c1_g1_i2:143-2032(+)
MNHIVTPRTAYQRSIGFEDEEIGIEKGLMNAKGDNNCFINAVIQALWHITPFRTSFSVLESHQHTISSDSESCIFCCLKIIFAQYEFGQDPVLPTSALREAMSKVFSSQNRFELGKFADATETLEEIIKLLHHAVTLKEDEKNESRIEDDNCEPPCFVHRVFRLNICEQQHCLECNQYSEPLMINDFVHYVYAATMREISSDHPHYELDQILKTASSMDGKMCTNTKFCKRSQAERYLLSNPEAFCVGIVWDSPDCSREEISSVLKGISEQLDLKKVFDSIEGQVATYHLKGMICYYGHHYDAYFHNKHENTWYVFDDAVVRKVEESGFKGVKKKCVLGKFQPSLLFYERVNSSVSSPVIKKKTSIKDEATKTRSDNYDRQMKEDYLYSKIDSPKREKSSSLHTKDSSYSSPSVLSSHQTRTNAKLKHSDESPVSINKSSTSTSSPSKQSSPIIRGKKEEDRFSSYLARGEEEELKSSYFNARKEEEKRNEMDVWSEKMDNLYDPDRLAYIFGTNTPSYSTRFTSSSSNPYTSPSRPSTQNKTESHVSKNEFEYKQDDREYSKLRLSSPYRRSPPDNRSTSTQKSNVIFLDSNPRLYASIPTNNSITHSKRTNSSSTPIATLLNRPVWR